MTTEKKTVNPYPGFRSYKVNESNLFFGREKQITEIVSKLTVNKFVALAGPSGSGKSSLISAGIIPALNAINDDQGFSTGKTILTRPGSNPLRNLAEAFVEAGIIEKDKTDDKTDDKIENTINILQEGNDGVKRILGDSPANIQGNLMIVIDQFEELFLSEGTNHSSAAKEREKYTEVLAGLHKQEDLPVYLIIAIRSDFIAECYQFLRLSQLINQSNHFLSPMTSEEILEVIHKPAVAGGAQIDQALEKKILDELYGKPDLLPSLQYYLNKIWEYWLNQGNYEKPLSLKEYDAVGNIHIAISTEADKIYNELQETGKDICRKLFKSITGKDTNNRDVSYPKSIAGITSITGSSIEETIEVINRFRQPGAAFLNSSYDSDLTEESIIELSHESLIRLWDRLSIWVKEEADSIKMYKHLAEQSRLYQMKKVSLLKNNDLQLALKWRDDNNPTSEWATWHHTAFERTMTFLDKSEEEYKREEEEKLQEPYKNLRRAKVSAIVFGIVALVSTGMFLHTSDFFVTSAGQTASSNREITQTSEQSANDEVQESGNLAATTDTKEEDTGQQVQENVTRGSSPGQRGAGTQRQAENQTARNVTTNRESAGGNISSGTSGDGNTQETSTEENLRNKLQEIGPALVARTSEIENNPDLKALLAVQAQIFSSNFDISIDYPGHYTNLHSSLKALLGDNFNAFRGHSGSVNSVVFRPNSSIFYSTSADGKVLKWDINDERKTPVTLIENSGINNSLAISSNGQWLAVATNGQGIKIFNPTRNTPFPITINRGNNRFTAIDFHPDNQHLIFADSDNNIIKYNITTGSNQLFATSEREIFSISVSPDGSKIAAGTRGGQIIIWTGETDPVKEVINHDAGNDVHVVQFNNNGSWLASGSLRGDIRIWDVATGNLVTSLDNHTARVVDIKFSPRNDKIASTSFDGTINLWDINRLNAEPLTLSDHGSWVLSVSFNSSGDRLISGSRQENRLMSWYLETDEMVGLVCSGLPRNLTREEWNRYIGPDIPFMETCAR